MTEADRRRIAGRARTLIERLTEPQTGGPPVDCSPLVEWERRLASTDGVSLESRLNQLGVDRATARERLASHGSAEPPPWTETLAAMSAFLAGDPPVPPSRLDGRPFADVVYPIAVFTLDRLTTPDVVPARADVAAGLVDRLVDLLGQSLFVTFAAARKRADTGYEAFVETRLDDGLREFFRRYSFLARVTVGMVTAFGEYVTELCRRIERDRSAIGERFFDGREPGPVTGVSLTGDAHAGARQVAVVQFDAGRVIYKPRPVRLGAGLSTVVETLTARVSDLALPTLTHLPRDGYGWVEHASATTPTAPDEITQYYRRAGAITCLLDVLGFSDGHLTNVRGVEGGPVVIDGETLLGAGRRAMDDTSSVMDVVRDTVIETGVVPRSLDGAVSDTAAFGAGRIRVQSPNRRFTAVNTDEMGLTLEREGTITGEGLPQLGDDPHEPATYANRFREGFERAYRLLSNEPERLRAVLSAEFVGCEGRHLLRSTERYDTLRKLLADPTNLKTGLPFSCKLEELLAPFAADEGLPTAESIRRAETRALLRFDIPRFGRRADRRHLWSDGVRLDDFFAQSGIDRAFDRIDGLGAADLREQLSYLGLAYDTTKAVAGERPTDRRPVDRSADAVPDADTLRTHARGVVSRLCSAVRWDGDEPVWYARRTDPGGGVAVSQIGDGVYEGRLGVAIAVASVLPDSDGLVDRIVSTLDPVGDSVGGLGYGTASRVYGLTVLSRITNERSYRRRAAEVAEQLTESRITDATRHGVLSGTAGVVLSMLALDEATTGDAARRRARWAGDHLRACVETDGRRRGWRDPSSDAVLTGFAHGVDGAATALCRLGDRLDDDRYVETARECLDSTETLYRPSVRNWPDTRPNADRRFPDAWCYGRSGGGLARLALAAATDTTPHTLPDVLTGTLERRHHDHLCCGDGSKATFLLTAGRMLGNDRHVATARCLLGDMLDGKSPDERFVTKWGTDQWTAPGFFQGEAGIAYLLCRAQDPDLTAVAFGE